MKKVMIALLLLSSSMAFAQAPGFGIKGGLNYGSVGDITSFGNFMENFELQGEDQVGYHVGAYGKIKLVGLFVQPEILYTKLSTDYTFEGENDPSTYNFSKIDVPILVGVDILGPLSIKAGPSFQYILDNEFENIDIDLEEPENSFTLGYQIGAGLTLGQLGIDLRYEGAISDNTVVTEAQVENMNLGFEVDARPSQWILSVSYSFKNSKN